MTRLLYNIFQFSIPANFLVIGPQVLYQQFFILTLLKSQQVRKIGKTFSKFTNLRCCFCFPFYKNGEFGDEPSLFNSVIADAQLLVDLHAAGSDDNGPG